MISTIRLGPGMDTNALMSAINDNFIQVENFSRTEVFKSDQGVNNIILGKYPDGTYGLKIAKEGVDVLKAKPDELVFDSSNNVFKIVSTGTKTFNSPNSIGSSTNTTFTHGLSYVPLVFAFVSFSPSGTRFPVPYQNVQLTGTDAGKVGWQVSMEVSTTNITFFHRDITQASNVTDYIRYYILRETAGN